MACGFADLLGLQVLEHVVAYLGLEPDATRQRNFLKTPGEVQGSGPQKAGFTFKGKASLTQHFFLKHHELAKACLMGWRHLADW